MSQYVKFKDMFGNSSCQAKLAIIRSESKRLMPIIQGYSQLIQKMVNESKSSELPDEFGEWCRKISNAADEMEDLINALTD